MHNSTRISSSIEKVLNSKNDLLLESNLIYKKVHVHGDVSICESLNIVQYITHVRLITVERSGRTIGTSLDQVSGLGRFTSVVEAFSGVKFLSEDTTPGMLQWADKFGAHEAEKPYLPTVTEFLEFTKKKFNVQ
ncbi:hypothetical protein F2Q69_00051214 [Brassica cretica]|uniref:Uncharacterized protein n=1 Tax=Brassica cretica TaxID=69181 RepID=A0A8S9Q453_BRACR|nr:hypothetical protein F2Q69_00051214 [Brassica cretica]